MRDTYIHPLCTRYAGKEMQGIFSDANRYGVWRRLWVALAEGQQSLGLGISDGQLEEMRRYVSDINFETAEAFERETRHDVMAHIKAYAAQCPAAAPIIHLGATSCYVGDNTDMILHRDALERVKGLLVTTIAALRDFAWEWRGLACLGYTHFQAAQPVTLGKRASLWLQDFMMDLEQLDAVSAGLKLLGCRGTTGTAAGFLALFDGDHEKVKALEAYITRAMGFDGVYAVSGQTYPRKVDYTVLSLLSGIAQSAAKFSNDIRLLMHLKEAEEPFGASQVGSSAMAYKRNPMRSERVASLARHVIALTQNPAMTAGTQWLERTLDDSANRRMAIPEAFLATDGILALVINIIKGLTVYPAVIKAHMEEELPFIATENILMHCVRQGGDRQEIHERIRVHAMEAARRVKEHGEKNDLLQRLLQDDALGLSEEALAAIMQGDNFTGRARQQVEEYIPAVDEVLRANATYLGTEGAVTC